MDVYAHVCNVEGFGLAAVEAMLAGIPVVAANAGALPEYVVNRRTGLLFEADNPFDLAANIQVLLLDETLRGALAQRGRNFCLAHFSPNEFADNLTHVLEGRVAREMKRQLTPADADQEDACLHM
jgi:glycosyltransferase involved in cell wall biosynthesis